MIVADVMTRQILSVSEDATVADAARMMLQRGVSGLFVVNEKGDLSGIITEADLLRRDELGTERHRPWWLRLLISPHRQATDFTRTHGRKVSDVMTRDVVTLGINDPVEAVVDAMERHRIKRVAVAENGRVVGVVSRADLLRALIAATRREPPVSRDDRSLRESILDTLGKESWAPTTSLNVTVVNGVVDVWGAITDEAERRAISVAIENTAGVKQVIDHLVLLEPLSGTLIESDRTQA